MIGSAIQRIWVYPLGFPLCVSTNSDAVLRAVRAEYGDWTRVFDEDPVTLHVEVAGEGAERPPAAEFRGHRHLFAFVADAGNFAVGDTSTGSGKVWITPQAAADAAYFRYHFLDGMVSLLIEAFYLTPIHAACVSQGNRGVLLCGDSGAGKSTLAYACARRGWTYVTDDGSYLFRRRASERLVVGNARRIRLRPEASGFFPELSAHSPAMRGNGKLTLELSTQSLGPLAISPTAAAERMVFLQRKAGGRAEIKAFGKAAARDWCERVFFHWNPAIAAEQKSTLSTLLDTSEVQALEYSNLEEAVDALER
jgi:hypothetical protein